MRRLTVAVALMLVATLSTSVWASCMAEIGMAASEQMACCESGHEKCPMHRTAPDCCQWENQRHIQVNVAIHDLGRSLLNPPALTPVAVPDSFVSVFVRSSQPISARDILKGPSPPAYLAGSAFLI
jgi:hypothetical protein